MIVLAGDGPLWDNPTFWIAVSLAVLIWLFFKFGLFGAIGKLLDDRAAQIKSELDDARRLKEGAVELLEDYKRRQAAAEAEAQFIIDNARREAEALAAETRRSLQETVERRTRQAEDKIARAERQAVAEVRLASVEKAVAAAEKLLAARADSGLVDNAIVDLKRQLN